MTSASIRAAIVRPFHMLALLLAASLVAPAAWAQDALSVVDAYIAAWNEHDAAKAASYFTDDVTYYDASIGTPQVGRDEARVNIIEAFMNAAPDANWQRLGEPVVSGDQIAFEWVFKGTNTGNWGDGTPATNKPFSFQGVSFIRLKGGKIAYQGDYYDALGFYKQLGLM